MKKKLAVLLSLLLVLESSCAVFGTEADGKSDEKENVSAGIAASSAFISDLTLYAGTTDGDWGIIALARSDAPVDDAYYEKYINDVFESLLAGTVSSTRLTDYARLVMALTALGQNGSSFSGYDLTAPLADFDSVIRQGLTGPVWALLAFDSASYPVPCAPSGKVSADREKYLEYILSKELDGGGFNLSGKGAPDVDVTAMTLQALAPYRDREDVSEAVERGLDCLLSLQGEDGGFSAFGSYTAESCAQVIIALCSLGISPEDPAFVKNGISPVDAMNRLALGDGSYAHGSGQGPSLMATEQCLCALAAIQRFLDGRSNLYTMDDAVKYSSAGLPGKGEGLASKIAQIKPQAVINKDACFPDIKEHPEENAIIALAQRGIISGMKDGSFAPDKNMTRAQFASIVTLSLGLEPSSGSRYTDVSPDAWYAGFVETASVFGIAGGKGGGTFDPDGTITRQEVSAMVANAAGLCGLDTYVSPDEIRDELACFSDYPSASSWAGSFLAFCVREGIMDRNALRLEPLRPVTRAEIAGMILNLLNRANLL